MTQGLSVVICCHNSRRLLPATLAHLAAQQFDDDSLIASEVLVIDNASTDNTANVARDSWPAHSSIPLRVIAEPELGLSAARRRGLAEARYDVICFVDDDNRVSGNWMQTVASLVSEHPDVGAFGGQIEAASEAELPGWFRSFQNYYAVGKQSTEGGDVSDSRGYLWGAGLCLRREAWETLAESNFTFALSGRKGTGLTAGEDAELCFALRLAGWRLWYEPRLKIDHFLPVARLKWSYLRKISRGFGAATVTLDAYEAALKPTPTGFAKLRRTWLWQTLATVKSLLRMPLKLLMASFALMEGDADVLRVENLFGRLSGLIRCPIHYGASLRRIRSSAPHTIHCSLHSACSSESSSPR